MANQDLSRDEAMNDLGLTEQQLRRLTDHLDGAGLLVSDSPFNVLELSPKGRQ